MFDLSTIQIVKADESDDPILTEISFAAKRHWKYPDNYFDLWKNELTITKDYINQNTVYKALYGGLVLGFYSIIENKIDFYSGEILVKKGFWLEHIFIKPDYHKNGIGRLLMDHAKSISKNMKINELMIFVDPHAKGFYDRIGADYLYDSKSSIPGRWIPVYVLKVF
jgi:GNAT superfamily N-acetyltransferase